MVTVDFDNLFEKRYKKIKDVTIKLRVRKQIAKIIESPETGKPMRHSRKDTREVYVEPFRLSYAYLPEENKIIFLDLYHKDEQ